MVFNAAFAVGVRSIDDGNDCALTAANWRAGAPFLILAGTSTVGLMCVVVAKRGQAARVAAVPAPE